MRFAKDLEELKKVLEMLLILHMNSMKVFR